MHGFLVSDEDNAQRPNTVMSDPNVDGAISAQNTYLFDMWGSIA
jgi:hypothetical protein